MLIKFELSGNIDTTRQDKYLQESLEKAVFGKASDNDIKLILQTFKARIERNNLYLSIINQANYKQNIDSNDANLNPF
jgi:RNA binding exosome subunit